MLFPPRPMMPGGAASARPLVAPRPVAPASNAAGAAAPVTVPRVADSNASAAGAAPATRPATATAPLPVAPQPPRPAAAGAPSGSSAPVSARTPINPFLANDPHAKARRLARALVSDLVTYFPQKRQDGLRDGTLKQLFKDEIQKSYEEYVAQVGREFAESTPHFQDALNDLLASGQKVF
jgi:hypothetical protein